MGRKETYVVAFLLEPVEWLLRAPGAVPEVALEAIVLRVGTAPTRDLWLGKSDIRCRAGHVAAEAIHVVWRRVSMERLGRTWRALRTLFTTAVRL